MKEYEHHFSNYCLEFKTAFMRTSPIFLRLVCNASLIRRKLVIVTSEGGGIIWQ